MKESFSESGNTKESPWLVVGLGNPGRSYIHTRHNLGFMVADRLADDFGMQWHKGRGEYRVASGKWDGVPVILAKPQTFMNLSGSAVVQLKNYYKIETSALLIICDDINLPFGCIRLRSRGSNGGHNGLASIITHLGTQNFARLRIGVGSDYHYGKMKDHVLRKFKKAEMEELDSVITNAAKATISFVIEGLEKTMNIFN